MGLIWGVFGGLVGNSSVKNAVIGVGKMGRDSGLEHSGKGWSHRLPYWL